MVNLGVKQMKNLNKIFELDDGSFMLATSYGSKLDSVDRERKLLCGPTINPRHGTFEHMRSYADVHDSWVYLSDVPEEAAAYVPVTIRRALESFRTASS